MTVTGFEEITITLEDGYRAYARWWPVDDPAGRSHLQGQDDGQQQPGR